MLMLFCVVMPCEFIRTYEPTFQCNILPPSSRPEDTDSYVPVKHWYLLANLHGISTQKTNNDMTLCFICHLKNSTPEFCVS
jgi:5-methylcytosine-specific restriction endonuclease McrA